MLLYRNFRLFITYGLPDLHWRRENGIRTRFSPVSNAAVKLKLKADPLVKLFQKDLTQFYNPRHLRKDSVYEL
jgi:hypothetical protein